tara:strand:+ start:1415 stop:2164 length:750 start_codon:yes stop_codon:yes gene_type:complete
MSMFNPTEFKFHNISVSLPLDKFVISKIKSYGQSIDAGNSIPLKNISISRKGFVLTNQFFVMEFHPDCWNDFLKSRFKKSHLFNGLDGIECSYLMTKYESWLLSENSKIAVQMLKSSGITFEEIRKNKNKSISKTFDHEPLKSYFYKAEKLTSNKRGKRALYELNEYQLYMYANHYFVHRNFSSYKEACAQVVEEFKELIPSTWSLESADSNLSTRVTAKYDKHPEYSQKSYRKNKNKNKNKNKQLIFI